MNNNVLTKKMTAGSQHVVARLSATRRPEEETEVEVEVELINRENQKNIFLQLKNYFYVCGAEWNFGGTRGGCSKLKQSFTF